MKLSRLEKRVLKVIHDAYPIPYDPEADKGKVLAIGERPIINDETIQTNCVCTLSDVRQTTEKLLNFQLIHRVYLCDPKEFVEQGTGGGHTIRLIVLVKGAPFGQYIFQITKHGVAEVEKFVPERLKRAFWKAVEEKGGLVLWTAIGAMGGAFLAWLGLKH